MKLKLLGPNLALAALLVACAGPQTGVETAPPVRYQPVASSSDSVDVRLVGVLDAGNNGTLVSDPGWLEFLVEVHNGRRQALTITDLKVLTPQGRYVASATAYDQITTPPGASAELAGEIAARSAGIAAGQAIPYGGTIVGLVRGAMADSTARSRSELEREFAVRLLNNVELAPGGRVTGSAFLPNVANPRTLVLDWRTSARNGRVELELKPVR
jgi:hypothetical protein